LRGSVAGTGFGGRGVQQKQNTIGQNMGRLQGPVSGVRECNRSLAASLTVKDAAFFRAGAGRKCPYES
jgi:hypothetical protein